MVDAGFTPRPLYTAVKAVASVPGVAEPGTFSITDPAAAFSGTWAPILSAGAVGGVLRGSSTPGDSLTITFNGGGLELFVQRTPNAGQVYVTVDGREASDVPDHVQGRSVLNVSGTDQEGPTLFRIASMLGPGQHVMRLVVGPTAGTEHGLVSVAGFEVLTVDRFAALWGVLRYVVLGALVGLALVVVRRLVLARR
jgi:hypothetical protein